MAEELVGGELPAHLPVPDNVHLFPENMGGSCNPSEPFNELFDV